MPCQGGSLMRDSLHQIPITHDDVDVVIYQADPLLVKRPSYKLFCNSHPHSCGEVLPERARCCFHSGCVAKFRVSGSFASILPEVFQILQGDLIRSEEHTSELQSRGHLVCRLLLEKKKRKIPMKTHKPSRRPRPAIKSRTR